MPLPARQVIISVLILALDTSSSSGSIALARDGCLISELNSDNVGTHSAWLMPSIHSLMTDSGIDAAEIDVVAVSMGPGSFTGLRIGVSIAKGIAWTLGCRIIGVSTLKALALNVGDLTKVAVPILDARRGEVYSALYSVADGEPALLFKESAITIDLLLKEIVELGAESNVLFTGDGLKVYKESILKTLPEGVIAAPELWRVRAGVVAGLAFKELDAGNKGKKPEDFLPLYLRKSEAEIKLKKRRGEQQP